MAPPDPNPPEPASPAPDAGLHPSSLTQALVLATASGKRSPSVGSAWRIQLVVVKLPSQPWAPRRRWSATSCRPVHLWFAPAFGASAPFSASDPIDRLNSGSSASLNTGAALDAHAHEDAHTACLAPASGSNAETAGRWRFVGVDQRLGPLTSQAVWPAEIKRWCTARCGRHGAPSREEPWRIRLCSAWQQS